MAGCSSESYEQPRANSAQLVVVDWGTLTAWAPAAVDYAWYIAVNSAAVGLPLDVILDSVRATDAGSDEVALQLALVGALAPARDIPRR